MTRIFLTTSDLQILTGKSYRNCVNTMNILKAALKKEKHQHVTIEEYCNYENISSTEVIKALNFGVKKSEKYV